MPRSSWKGYLKLSLVSCAVALYNASSSSERVSFNTLNRKTGNRLKQNLVDSASGEPVDTADRVKGYQVAKGQYVLVEDSDLEALQDRSGSMIHPPQIALVAFPGAVPQLAVDPGDPGDEAVGFYGAKNCASLRIDLMDLPGAVLSHPERPFGPREPRVTAAARGRDRGEHTAGVRIDLVDAILGELKQVPAVERGSRMPGDFDRAHCLSAGGIEGVQPVSRCKPDVPAVERHAVHLLDTRKGAIFTEDFGG